MFFCIFEETEFELESIKKEDEGKAEKMSRFFEVEEMFDFDNLGFTNTRDNFKARHFVFTGYHTAEYVFVDDFILSPRSGTPWGLLP